MAKKKNKTSKKKKSKVVSKKKQLSKKDLLKKLKKAKVKEKSLDYYKKLKDSKFRKEAKNELFIPTTDLNSEVRLKTKTIKRSKGEIQSQRNKIRFLEKENRKITKKAKELKKQYEFEDEEGKLKIQKLLDKPDYKKKDLFIEKNLLKAFEGKDFDFIVNDGFKTYKLNTKDLKKYWKKGQNITLPILKRMKVDIKEAITYYTKLIKKDQKTASKQTIKKLKRILTGLKNKLEHTVNKNIEAIETGDMKVLDEFSDEGEKAYSLLFKVVGYSIDRIGI